MTTQLAVEVSDLRYRYADQAVLRGILMSVAHNEVVAVMGQSGSGKSTLLHAIAGLLPVDSGSIKIEGSESVGLREIDRDQLRLERFGIVTQSGDLLPELTLRENIELPSALLRQAPKFAAQELAEDLQISELLERRVWEVSGGQLQRAAIARALAHGPQVLLADEPTGALDGDTATQVIETMIACGRGSGASVIVVTHDPAVAAMADRILHLVDGDLLES